MLNYDDLLTNTPTEEQGAPQLETQNKAPINQDAR